MSSSHRTPLVDSHSILFGQGVGDSVSQEVRGGCSSVAQGVGSLTPESTGLLWEEDIHTVVERACELIWMRARGISQDTSVLRM
jgi:hypothetical protein